MKEQIAFPVEKLKLLSDQELQLIDDYKRKEQEATTALQKMYYTGRIHAVYELADLLYQERLKAAKIKDKLQKLG